MTMLRKITYNTDAAGRITYPVDMSGVTPIRYGGDYVLARSPEPIAPVVTDEDAAIKQAAYDAARSLSGRRRAAADILAMIRYRHEVAGVTLPDGATITTRRQDQAMITGTYQALASGLITATDFKGSAGWVQDATLAEIEPIAQAVARHVDRCFRAERQVAEQIDAAKDADALDAMDLAAAFKAAYEALAN